MANIKKVIEAGFIIFITLLSTITITTQMIPQMIPTAPVSEGGTGLMNVVVENFVTIWYDGNQTLSTTKLHDTDIALIKASYTNGSARNIDQGIVTLERDPLHFSITVYDRYTDEEGFPFDAADGYIYLNKTAADSYFSDGKDSVATKDLYYQTVTYQGQRWYRIYIEQFNPEAHDIFVKEYKDPKYQEAWFSSGSASTIKMMNQPMFIDVTDKDSTGFIIKFSHPVSNAGQPVAFNKSYLASLGITRPVFEWGEQKPWKMIDYEENATHYIIYPEHFSYISVHMPTSGEAFQPNFRGTAMGQIMTPETPPWYYSEKQTSAPTFKSTGGAGQWQLIRVDYPMTIYGLCCYIRWFHASYNYAYFYESNAAGAEIKLLGNWSNYWGAGQDTHIGWADHVFGFKNNRTGLWVNKEIMLNPGTYYKMKWVSSSAYSSVYGIIGNPYPKGDSSQADFDFGFMVYTMVSFVNVTRTWNDTVGMEKNTLNYTSTYGAFSGTPMRIKIPVSTNVETILSVKNNANTYLQFPEATNYSSMEVNTYYFDRGNKYVYVGIPNITGGQNISYTVNCYWYGGYLYPYHTGEAYNPVQGGKWWNDQWTYRKKVPYTLSGLFIQNNIGTMSSYRKQISIYRENGTDSPGVLYLNGHSTSNFSDIRFVQDIKGIPTKIPYLINNDYGSYVNVYIYFRLDGEVDGTDDNEIYIYYGAQSTYYAPVPINATVTSRPDGPGDVTQLTVNGAATNWECVDDVISDKSTTYVSMTGHDYKYDLYSMGDMDLSGEQINSITVNMVVSVDGMYNNLYIKTHGTIYSCEYWDHSSWVLHSWKLVNNPFTSVPWTWAEITSLQVGEGSYDPGNGGFFKCTQVYVTINYTSGYYYVPVYGESGIGVGSYDCFIDGNDPVWLTPNSEEHGPIEAFNIFRIQGISSEQDSIMYNATKNMENAVLRIELSN